MWSPLFKQRKVIGQLAVSCSWPGVCDSLIISLSSKQKKCIEFISIMGFEFVKNVCVVVWKNPSDISVTEYWLLVMFVCIFHLSYTI